MAYWEVVTISLMLMLWAVSSGTSANSPWNLPYDIRPLIQNESENLLPSLADARGSRAWQLGDGASAKSTEGECALYLTPGGRFSVTVPITGGRLYVLEMEFQFAPDTVFPYRPFAGDVGVNGWVSPLTPDNTDKGTGAYSVCEVRLADGWQQHRSYFYAGSRIESVRIGLGLGATQGGAAIRRFSLRAVAVAAEDGLSVVNDGKGEWGELPRQPEPPLPTAATLYHRRDPDRLFPYSAPAEHEVGQPMVLSGTPGEVLVAVTGLFTPVRLERVALSVSDLTSEDAQRLAARFDWCEVRYAPRKPNFYGRGRTFQVVADSLWSRPNGSTAEAGQTAVFWLRLTLPANAEPGEYRGTLTTDTPAGQYTLPVQLRVLPFALVDLPSRTWGLFVDAWRWIERGDGLVVHELADIKAHGVESVFVYGVDIGDPVWQDDRVTGWHLSPEIERFVPLVGQAGLRGPLLVDWGSTHERLARHLGVDPELMKQHADKWPAELGTAYLEALRAFDKEWRARGWGEWVYVGLDEPGYWNPGTPELFRFLYGAAAAARLPSFCTSNELPSDPVGQPLTYHCFGTQLTDSPTIADAVLQEARQYGQHACLYASGSYHGQVGRLLPNRWITGFLFYKTGAEGSYSWTFQRPKGPDPFDDFYDAPGAIGRTGIQPCITYPDPERRGGNLDTPHWEAVRQGWYDYRYAATLADAIERAKKRPAKRSRASQIEREFLQLIDSMPWSAGHVSVRPETNLSCDEWRGEIAAMLIRLEEETAD